MLILLLLLLLFLWLSPSGRLFRYFSIHPYTVCLNIWGNPFPFEMWQPDSHQFKDEMGDRMQNPWKDVIIQEMWHDEVKFNCFPAEKRRKKNARKISGGKRNNKKKIQYRIESCCSGWGIMKYTHKWNEQKCMQKRRCFNLMCVVRYENHLYVILLERKWNCARNNRKSCMLDRLLLHNNT